MKLEFVKNLKLTRLSANIKRSFLDIKRYLFKYML